MRSYINVNLSKIKRNVEEIKKINPKTLIAVVKSNAYGLGSVEITKFLESLSIKYFCVATLQEAIQLRKNNIRGHIIVLEKSNDFLSYIKFNLIYVVYDLDSLKEIIRLNLPLRFHIKFNTGLNRLGIEEENIDQLKELILTNKLHIEGIFSHISSPSSYEEQLVKFKKIAEKFDNFNNLLIHLDSSRFIDKTNFTNAIRVGLSLFSFKENAVSLISPIIKQKQVYKNEIVGYNPDSRTPSNGYLITIPLGYADGWNSYRITLGYVDNFKIQQIGDTCMDHLILFSQKEIKSPTIEIIGDHITLSYLSSLYEESEYHILATLSSRLKRNYFK